ncbi:hypothetical protein [Psychrobacter sp. I-STPA10]|uniref:hypothetical protein n=1 Tax=Psychrobacter sp. I-STPA10 TaxID=2585769 RepID=UPI001E33A9A7|nr:hypothetical protein [Psychrobacter sp. I-STPA10]
MAYAIHTRGFEYNDAYFEPRSHLETYQNIYQTYSNKEQAMKAWGALERAWLDLDLLVREPFAGMADNGTLQKLQVLFDKLQEHGVVLSKATEEKFSKMQRQDLSYWSCSIDNQELQLDKLSDEQLLDVLLATDCNAYCLTEFDSVQDRRYVLQFCYRKWWQNEGFTVGYLDFVPLDSNKDQHIELYAVLHPDELFEIEFFTGIFSGHPLVTLYQQADESNPILQSLLAQYAQHFAIKKFAIKQQGDETNGETELHYIGGDTQALRAVNAVLSQPFFHIHELSYEELMQLQEEQNQEPAQNQYINKQYEDNSTHHEHKTESSIWQKVRQWFG